MKPPISRSIFTRTALKYAIGGLDAYLSALQSVEVLHDLRRTSSTQQDTLNYQKIFPLHADRLRFNEEYRNSLPLERDFEY